MHRKTVIFQSPRFLTSSRSPLPEPPLGVLWLFTPLALTASFRISSYAINCSAPCETWEITSSVPDLKTRIKQDRIAFAPRNDRALLEFRGAAHYRTLLHFLS